MWLVWIVMALLGILIMSVTLVRVVFASTLSPLLRCEITLDFVF
jgi:hypothetical protein